MRAAAWVAVGVLSSATGQAADGGPAPEIQVFPALGQPARFAVSGRALRGSSERGEGPLARNVRRLVGNKEWKNVALRVTVKATTREVQADDEGFFEAHFDDVKIPLEPGAHVVVVEGPDGARGEGTLQVVSKGQVVVVSDFDDTVAITHVTDKTKMVRTALWETEETQSVVPGMAALYSCLAGGSGASFLFLSGSPPQFYPRLGGFLQRHGFPRAAMVLRRLDQGALDAGSFKGPQLERLERDLPDARFVFFGDSGERDPEVYAAARQRLDARALRTYIRVVTGEPPTAPRFNGALAFREATEAAADAASRGLITKACLEGVQKAPLP